MSGSAVRIADVYPELLGTYGDGGNGLVLRQRLAWRGLPVELVTVPAGAALPADCDVYLLGGGEDAPQTLAAAGLRRGGLRSAVEGGAAVLAVCAAFQILGESFEAGDGVEHEGLGLLDCRTRRSWTAEVPPRAVGDLAVEPDPALGLPLLLGYENHGGRTVLGDGARPLGRVVRGIGNGTPDRGEGLVHGHVVATYLHGPALAQNPALADLLLGWVVGELPPLTEPPVVRALRAARMRDLGIAA